MKLCSRREFLKRLSFAQAACAALVAPQALNAAAGGAGKAGGGAGRGARPHGAPFRDPAEAKDLSSTAGLVEVDLEARPAQVQLDGNLATMLTYNGCYPGPTIRVKQGDRLNIHFRNALPEMGQNILGHDREVTNLHIHGLHVSPGGESDNTAQMLLSGNTFDYRYDLSAQEPGTLHFYHALNQGTAAEQLWMGLAGALVVEDATSALSRYETHILVLKDLSLSGGAPEPYASLADYRYGKEGALVMVNGQVDPVLPIRPGQVQRWRLLNASTARFFHLSLESHVFHIIGTDGGLLDKPHPLPSVLLAPGERLDVLIKAGRTPKRCRLIAEPYDRGHGLADRQRTLLTLACEGAVDDDALPAAINANARRATAVPVKTEQLVLRMDRGRGTVNGISFSDTEAYTIESSPGTHEVWELVNQSPMDHVFHVQTNAFQVISLAGGDQAYAALCTKTPAWKDTLIVPRQGSAKILVPVMDFTGRAVFYCQIIGHADIGMMGVWDIFEAEKEVEGSQQGPEQTTFLHPS